MGWFIIVLKVIPVVIKLMRIAEDLFDDVPDSGADKKRYVMEAIKAVIEGISGFTGSPELWAKIEKAISLLIDAVCVFMFPHDDDKEKGEELK